MKSYARGDIHIPCVRRKRLVGNLAPAVDVNEPGARAALELHG